MAKQSMNNAITDVEGIKVGHYTDAQAMTGCTAVLCEQGAVAGVDVRGSAPATHETDLLHPLCLVDRVHAILLTGGSTFGLSAVGGVVRFLEERGCGFVYAGNVIPIVPAAAIFDLAIGNAKVRPGAAEGFAAAQAATGGAVAEGSVGAGTGATVGHFLGLKFCMKSGLGTASEKIGNGIVVGAIVVVNPYGDVLDPATGKIVAGTRKPVVGGFINTAEMMKTTVGQSLTGLANTAIGIVATNATLSKVQVNKVAQMAHDGLAISVRPVHTMNDGDAIFALATGKAGKDTGDVNVIGTVAAQVLAHAVVRAVQQASGLAGVPAVRDL